MSGDGMAAGPGAGGSRSGDSGSSPSGPGGSGSGDSGSGAPVSGASGSGSVGGSTLARVLVPGALPGADGLAVRADGTPLPYEGERELVRSLADVRLPDPDLPRFTPPSLIVVTDRRIVWVDPTAGKPTGLLALLRGGGSSGSGGGSASGGGALGGDGASIGGLHPRGLIRSKGPTEVLAGQRRLEDVDRIRIHAKERRVEVDELVLVVDRSADIRRFTAALREALGAPPDADAWIR